MAGAVFRHLAGAARDHVLVTLAATLRVVGRSQAVGGRLHFLEDEAVVVERSQRHRVDDGGEVRALRVEAVGAAIEPGEGFSGSRQARRRARLVSHALAARCEALPAVVFTNGRIHGLTGTRRTTGALRGDERTGQGQE